MEREARRQLAAFQDLFGRLPDHLDSHQHAHRQEPARSILIALGRELDVPVRHFSEVRYCGDFYGQDEKGNSYPELISTESFVRIIRRLPPGTSELCCHPAAAADLDSMYQGQRVLELQSLCDPQSAEALRIENVSARSFLTERGRTRG